MEPLVSLGRDAFDRANVKEELICGKHDAADGK
jgi:hypothetical protein